jgi:hypothetical protein
MVRSALKKIQTNKMSFEQLNEILLLMNQNRITRDFFDYFFKDDCITIEELKEGITKFRGYAMLCFGNFRFSFKELLSKDNSKIMETLEPFSKMPTELKDNFKYRPDKILDIKTIERDLTPFVGELTGRVLVKEEDFWVAQVQKVKRSRNKQVTDILELIEIRNQLDERKATIKKVEAQALENSEVYLTWDCMDVYIATSMRYTWEFQETYEFIKQVFSNSITEPLKLRYFDPTQSKCKNAREKGLIEGLMLKRCLCSIYMAQEGDTIGKDSELAATLSQSKPVIAYVPQHNEARYAEMIATYPLDFFKTRLQILNAQGTLNEGDCESKLQLINPKFQDMIDSFLEEYDEFKRKEPYSFPQIELPFKTKFKEFSQVCKLVATAECYNYEKRAKLLMGLHPLSMQINLETGVSNGLLVVRNAKDCSRLLRKLLTNNMTFTIKQQDDCTFLIEETSHCPYRAITNNEKLTNCFWNYFSKT